MKEAIHKITGMEAYKELLTDPRSLKLSLDNKLAKSVRHIDQKKYQSELDEIAGTLANLESRKMKLLSEIHNYDEMIKVNKQTRNNKVSQNSKSREVIVKQQSRVATELELTSKKLAGLLQVNTINIILRDKINKLQKQLKTENEINRKRILQDASLTPYRNFMEQLLSQSINPALTKEQQGQIKQIGEEVWIKENKISKTISADQKEIHDIANNDFNFLVNLAIKDKTQVTNLINKIERLQQELTVLESEIRNAPEAVNIDEENSKIDILTEKIGEKNLLLKNLNRKINVSNDEKANIMNKISRLSGQDENTEVLQKRIISVSQAIKAMEQYVTEVTTMKATFIKDEFSNMLKKLFRKQD